MKLNKKQNAAIYCLQNGWKITSDPGKADFKVTLNNINFILPGGDFTPLLKGGLIKPDFSVAGNKKEYILTIDGQQTKTTPVNW